MTKPIRGKGGKFAGSEGEGKKKVPTAGPAQTRTAEETAAAQVVDYEAQLAKARAKQSEVQATGKQGTDVPPLVAEIKKGRATYRFYAINPDVKEQLENGTLDMDEALNEGKAFPSITTCLGALDKPALPMWAAGVAADHGEKTLRELQALPADERDARLSELLAEGDKRTGRSVFRKEAGSAHTKERDTAAARGTEVHAYAEQVVRGEEPEVPEELAGYVEAARKFRDAYPNMRFLYTEATVHNPEGRTMGTTDAIVEVGDKRYVLDYKTNKSASVYSSTGMQLAAAANAESIVHADGRKEPMPEIHGGIGVGLGPNGEMKVYLFETARDGANFQGFKAARAAWDWKYTSGRDPKPIDPSELG